jgi:hypothetical protein
LAVSTAASGLFVQLGLPLPSLSPKPTGRTILIWGGSSSCGSAAIQLAVAAGLTVATTASKGNSRFVRSLGASHIFDYNDPNVIDEILKVLRLGDVVLDAIGDVKTQIACGKILGNIGGGKLATNTWPIGPFPDNVQAVLGTGAVRIQARSLTGVFLIVNGLDPGMVNLDVGDAVWRKYLPEALAAGTFQAKPDPFIVKGGLEKAQEGIDLLRKGVSAKKIVIEIAEESF